MLASMITSRSDRPLTGPRCVPRYGAANMAAVKPMMQQPGRAKPNSSYNNNNNSGRSAAPSMHQELTVTQVPAAMFVIYPAQPAGSEGDVPKPSLRSRFRQMLILFALD